jgi:hypothetical protein
VISHDAGRLVHLLGWFGIALVTACLSMVIATLLHCWRDWPGSRGSVRGIRRALATKVRAVRSGISISPACETVVVARPMMRA